jgi:hypothetical protein
VHSVIKGQCSFSLAWRYNQFVLLRPHTQELERVLHDKMPQYCKHCHRGRNSTHSFFQLLYALDDALDHLHYYPRVRLALVTFESRTALSQNTSSPRHDHDPHDILVTRESR